MTNLTPSEARRLIDKLHHNQTKEHGISILEEKYLIGLEKALPFLDPIDIDSEALAVAREIMGIMYGPMPSGGSVQLMAQVQCLIIDAMKVARGEKNLSLQQPQTDTYRQIENDGWIEWGGGECPVDENVIVEIKVRSGVSMGNPTRAGYSRWWNTGSGLDIIAYRAIENDGREG